MSEHGDPHPADMWHMIVGFTKAADAKDPDDADRLIADFVRSLMLERYVTKKGIGG